MARGGPRPGAGRPKKSALEKIPADIQAAAESEDLTPLQYLLRLMNDPAADPARRDRAAQVLMPFLHPREADKRTTQAEEVQRRAQEAAEKFSRLRVVGKAG